MSTKLGDPHISADGSFIRLTSGEWHEVKGLAVGEFETVDLAPGVTTEEVKTHNLSYFTRSYRVRDFETFALAELARRGLDMAETVVAVNDGAEWLQSFTNYHCPTAVRILDFAHALGYVAEAGCIIRAMPITDSGPCRSLIPGHADHRFRPCRSPIPAMPISSLPGIISFARDDAG